MAHQCILSVAEAIEGGFKFNTGIAQCNKLVNQLRSTKGPIEPTVLREVLETVVRVLSPIIPHFSEEAWCLMGHDTSIFKAGWPIADREIAKEQEVTLVVQVNGKVRDKLSISASITEQEAKETALNSDKIKSHMNNRQVIKVIYVPGKLVNIVVK
jgi:leucyl-tRNA synthetase